jgi:hypothetical protein
MLVAVAALTSGWAGVALVVALSGAAVSTWLCLYTSSGIGA